MDEILLPRIGKIFLPLIFLPKAWLREHIETGSKDEVAVSDLSLGAERRGGRGGQSC